MDDFMKSSVISKSVDMEHISRTIHWLETMPMNSVSKQDVSVIFKCIFFITEYFRIFGNKLIIHTPSSKFNVNENLLCKWQCSDGIVSVCKQILECNVGIRHTILLEKMLRKVLEEDEVNSLLLNVELNVHTPIERNVMDSRHKMIAILQRLFKVRFEEIDAMIEKLLDHIEFEIIGCIFIEPKDSPFHAKCAIVERKILSLIENKKISFKFFRSIYVLASTSDDGLQFFVRSLKNTTFLKCLVEYFIKYLHYTSEIYKDGNCKLNSNFQNLYFPHMAFLIKVTLCNNSPYYCRSLSNCDILLNTINNLNKLGYVYDCYL